MADAAIDAGTPESCDDDPAACAYPTLRLPTACSDAPGTPASERPLALTITDAAIGREIPLLVCHPTEGGPFPIVLFEHGGSLRDDGEYENRTWASAIASQGYVVVRGGHRFYTPTQAAALCEAGGVTPADCMAEMDILYAVVRVTDLVAELDALPEVVAALTAAGRPTGDPSRVGVAGWSGGSHAPVTLAGAIRDLAATRYSAPDARPLATVLLSPGGPGFSHFFEAGADHSWVSLRGPTLFITGDDDIGETTGLTGPIRRRAFELSPADGSRLLLYATLPPGVVSHVTFNLDDRDSSDPRLVRFTAAIASTTLAFLDAHLKDDPDAMAYLASDLPRLLAGDADYEAR